MANTIFDIPISPSWSDIHYSKYVMIHDKNQPESSTTELLTVETLLEQAFTMHNTVFDIDNNQMFGFNAMSIDWSNRILCDTYNNVSLTWNNRRLLDYSQEISLDWGYRYLRNNNGAVSVDWGNMWLIDLSNNYSINWNTRWLLDSSGLISIWWDYHYMYDSSANKSINWSDRVLYDENGSGSIDWKNRQLIKADGSVAFDWQNTPLRAYKTTTLSIFQTGTNNPTLIATLIDEILVGAISISREGTGIYRISFPNTIDSTKAITFGTVTTGRITCSTGSDNILIRTYDNSGNPSDGILYPGSIKIEYYA